MAHGPTWVAYAAVVDALDHFSPPTRLWFNQTFPSPTAAQTGGWEAIAGGEHTLIHAPTGSGKTLAAFLWAIDRLATEPVPAETERCRVLYVSPLKALAYDVERNLRAPLTGIRLAAQHLGTDPPQIATAMRTGDTPQAERQAMLRHPPDILITTPESLYLMLTSQARKVLRHVRWVIVDEVHSVAATKRGTHLALSLERLQRLTDTPPQRIGLSATQRPLQRIAEFLGGGTPAEDGWLPRPVTVVDAPRDKQIDVEIVVPVADMTRPEESTPPLSVSDDDPRRRSIWPAVYPRLLALVEQHRSTILFVNSRGLAERLAAEINRLAGEELVQSHHGSVSREQRLQIEDRLKRGDLRGVVATSTLELGIDMAAVDLVVLVESPSSVARGMQRVGRAGHQVGAPSVAKVFPKHRGDLLETAVVVDRMYAGAIEETVVPMNPLDVLAQHVVATVSGGDIEGDDLFRMVRSSFPYRDLARSSFDAVLDMLSGRFPSDEFAELRPRIVWDRVTDSLRARDNARMLAVTNPGTIPDRGLYTVRLPDGQRVGELDEEMVYESRPGDVFVLGSTTWRIDDITADRVVVTPAPAEQGARMPFWHGDASGRPLELGRAVGAFTREIGGLDHPAAITRLEERYRLDPWAAQNLASFIAEEREATGVLPTDRSIVVERFRDEIGDWRIAVLSPFGARVHAPWALAARHRYRERTGADVDLIWSDDGILFRFPDVDEPPGTEEIVLGPDEVEELLLVEIGDTALYTATFREAAARALLLPRRRPGTRTPLWLQRRKAANLLEVARQYGSFPVVLETYREILQDHFDLPALRDVLEGVQKRTIRVTDVDVDRPSPFATSLMFDFVASFMYEYDAPIAEKRAAALTLDRSLLAELLGEPELRELLDRDVIEQVECELQHLTPDRAARTADGIHDLLRDLGPLTEAEIAARTVDDADVGAWLRDLESSRRILPVHHGGNRKLAAAEDVARLRDALGVAPPPGVADSLLTPLADPLGDVVARYARTHGPFTSEEAAATLALPEAAVIEVLRRLESSGRVTSGGYLPGGSGQEWVDGEVLRRIRRRTLAVLRREVEAVEPAAIGRFVPAWHGIGSQSQRPDRLPEIVRQLQGAAIPASILESDVLPSRMAYDPARLDDLLASGDVVWLGRGPIGPKDGRVALYLREQVPLLAWPSSEEVPQGSAHSAIRTLLENRGASFFRDLYTATGGGSPDDTLDALWDLVWAGEVTNDTMAPLRAFLWGRTRARGSRKPRTMSAATPPAGSGRWYLTAELGGTAGGEETAAARAGMLLERYGVVTRDAVLGEGVPGGFSGLYPVFAAMEDVGTVRRGYFIEGRGGAQFGVPGAIDRMRTVSGSGVVVLAAADPANPYGSLLDWPEHPAGRPARRAGAHVALFDGSLAVYVERGGRSVLTFIEPDPAVAAIAAVAARYRRLTIETVDGVPSASSPLAAELRVAGFGDGYKGMSWQSRGSLTATQIEP
jgi:ATP-dependent Lhr-like helicase